MPLTGKLNAVGCSICTSMIIMMMLMMAMMMVIIRMGLVQDGPLVDHKLPHLCQGRETPGTDEPLLFHSGIQAALASVRKHSAGLDCTQYVIWSCEHPSHEGSADTVPLRLFHCHHVLRWASRSIMYFPESFDIGIWSEAKQRAAQDLFYLLERLHELIQPGVGRR